MEKLAPQGVAFSPVLPGRAGRWLEPVSNGWPRGMIVKTPSKGLYRIRLTGALS